jgi:hypothetical protein
MKYSQNPFKNQRNGKHRSYKYYSIQDISLKLAVLQKEEEIGNFLYQLKRIIYKEMLDFII